MIQKHPRTAALQGVYQQKTTVRVWARLTAPKRFVKGYFLNIQQGNI
jgi:hypothetical protein